MVANGIRKEYYIVLLKVHTHTNKGFVIDKRSKIRENDPFSHISKKIEIIINTPSFFHLSTYTASTTNKTIQRQNNSTQFFHFTTSFIFFFITLHLCPYHSVQMHLWFYSDRSFVLNTFLTVQWTVKLLKFEYLYVYIYLNVYNTIILLSSCDVVLFIECHYTCEQVIFNKIVSFLVIESMKKRTNSEFDFFSSLKHSR